MSQRQRIARKLDRYADVRTMLSAMKNMALMEIHKLSEQIERQSRMLETVARAAGDFSAFYGLPAGAGAGVCIVIGAERGFCGEFNAELLAPLTEAQNRGETILLVGSRLAERLEEEGNFESLPIESLGGAAVAEEIPAVLEQVAAWLEQAQTPNVKVLYQDESAGKPVLETIAPLPVQEQAGQAYGHEPCLTLEPPVFLQALGEQSLLLSLEGLFTLSLAAENRRRLEHMDSALHRLDETTNALERRMNAARQEDIIQEIETIMLGSGSA
jgi:F-type H+-transporting ATPase subunit gamma